MKFFLFLVASLLVLAVGTPRADAQITILPYGGYDLSAGDPFVGIGVEYALFPEAAPGGLAIRPSAEYFFMPVERRGGLNVEQQRLQLNADIIANLSPADTRLRLFAGLGLGFHYYRWEQYAEATSETDLGLNIIGGVQYPVGPVLPFVQVRLTRDEGATLVAFLSGIRLGI